MPELLASAFFPSRPLQRLEKKATCTILDLDEASGAPRLTTCDLFGSASRNGLFVANNPVNASDPTGLNGDSDAGNAKADPPKKHHDSGGNWGIYVFNKGYAGIRLHGAVFGGTIFGGPGNPNGVSYGGSPVLAILSVGQSTQSSEDSSVSLAWIAPGVSLETLIKVATAAMDAAAKWAVDNKAEVAGFIDSGGNSVEGPKEGRTPFHSSPGDVTGALAVWHLHLLVGSNPYAFSFATANNPGRHDGEFIQAHPDLYNFLGVLDAPAGQFTIVGQVPHGVPYYIRTNSHTPPLPGG